VNAAKIAHAASDVKLRFPLVVEINPVWIHKWSVAWPAHGSRTAGIIISFFCLLQIGNSALARARENFRCRKSRIVNQRAGSSVCNGFGTIPAQTTIWYAVLINQVGREKAQRVQKNFSTGFYHCV
jgi:hypothetical protein